MKIYTADVVFDLATYIASKVKQQKGNTLCIRPADVADWAVFNGIIEPKMRQRYVTKAAYLMKLLAVLCRECRVYALSDLILCIPKGSWVWTQDPKVIENALMQLVEKR